MTWQIDVEFIPLTKYKYKTRTVDGNSLAPLLCTWDLRNITVEMWVYY